MEVIPRGLNSYVMKEDIVEVYFHIENYRGQRSMWIDKIVIHGSVESFALIDMLRNLRKYVREKMRIRIL